jgi:hypothetical protein
MLAFLKKRALRLWSAATLALIIYNIPTGALNFLWETCVVGYSLEQWGLIHVVYSIVKYGFAFVEARINHLLLHHFRAFDERSIKRKFVDALALALYQIPLYVAIALLTGRPLKQIGLCVCFSLFEHAAFGPYHGDILRWCQRRFSNGTTRVAAPLEPAVGE